jgi:branched-subunit amino acid ABC-type transport system permease component
VVAICGIWFMLYKTKFGRIIRAVKDNSEMVAAVGISLPKMYLAVYTLCGVLAAMASVSWSVMGTVNLGMTTAVMVQTFCVLIIGGMGSFLGTVVGALVCGEVYALGVLFFPRLALLFVVAITGIILAVRPWGLFGVKGMLH